MSETEKYTDNTLDNLEPIPEEKATVLENDLSTQNVEVNIIDNQLNNPITEETVSAQPDTQEVLVVEEQQSISDDTPEQIVTEEDTQTTIANLEAQITSLQNQLEAQTLEAQNTHNQHTRLNADFENFRRRTAKEKEELEQQIKKRTLTELLSVVDNFERARSQIKPSNDGEKAIHKSYQGVYKTFVDCLKKVGVSAMRPEGEIFDPNYHEAMLREPTNEYPEGTVIEELVRGYLLQDQVLRHAMVKVATEAEEETVS